MKILLANTTLYNFCGSTLFTYYLAVELENQGHENVIFSPDVLDKNVNPKLILG
jgi:hypothetical protein